MKKIILILFVLSTLNQVNAQIAKKHTYLSSNYTEVLNTNEIIIYAKVVQGKKSEDNATIYWQIKNKINKPIALEGGYQITGKPISGKLSNGMPAGKSKGGGPIPASKVNSYSTGEFESSAEWLNDVDAIIVTLDVVHKGDNIKSGTGN